MKITISAITADFPTANGRIYPKKLMEDMVRQYNTKIQNKTCLLTIDASRCLSDAIAVVTECALEESKIVIDVTVLDTPMAKKLEKLLTEFQVVPIATGNTDKDGTVADISVDCFTLIRGNSLVEKMES